MYFLGYLLNRLSLNKNGIQLCTFFCLFQERQEFVCNFTTQNDLILIDAFCGVQETQHCVNGHLHKMYLWSRWRATKLQHNN